MNKAIKYMIIGAVPLFCVLVGIYKYAYSASPEDPNAAKFWMFSNGLYSLIITVGLWHYVRKFSKSSVELIAATSIMVLGLLAFFGVGLGFVSMQTIYPIVLLASMLVIFVSMIVVAIQKRRNGTN